MYEQECTGPWRKVSVLINKITDMGTWVGCSTTASCYCIPSGNLQ